MEPLRAAIIQVAHGPKRICNSFSEQERLCNLE